MLRFEAPEQRRPRNYLHRREQYRLLALVAAVGAVVLLIQQFSSDNGSAVPGSAGDSPTVVEKSDPPVKPSAVEIVVDQERLANVRDNSLFRDAETDAWFYLFSLVKEQGTAIDSARAREATYTQLVAQPQTYRGHFVHVRGDVKRIEAVAPAENDLGIKTLYRVILKPPGHSPWPITVYCLELPAGWTAGEPPSNQVEVRGFFFKNHSYAWENGMALSPVIVTRSFSVRDIRTPSVSASAPRVSAWKIVGTASAIAVAAVALVLWRTAAPARPEPEHNATQVGQALRKLAREEK